MITAEILTGSLADFYCQIISRQTHEFIICAMHPRVRADKVIVKNKLMSVFNVCPVIDDELNHNIVKVVCRSTQLSPCGSTATVL